jgi:hypothetical protein
VQEEYVGVCLEQLDLLKGEAEEDIEAWIKGDRHRSTSGHNRSTRHNGKVY